ncbi:hypothetical protein ISN44_As06g042460 [Arabidopsis suecica]|uniref:Uncharacterized protein n=1 Tax=Arabidopsis suecica TaxID=45249 RepID=A0A8T2CKZ6_ARASU|nr:hypothetical protein ISN44_As06g042460 [Arabidopsis suecica]
MATHYSGRFPQNFQTLPISNNHGLGGQSMDQIYIGFQFIRNVGRTRKSRAVKPWETTKKKTNTRKTNQKRRKKDEEANKL